MSRLPGVPVAVDEGWETGLLHEDGWGGMGHLSHSPGLSWVGLAKVSVVAARGAPTTRKHLSLPRWGARLSVSGCPPDGVVHCKQFNRMSLQEQVYSALTKTLLGAKRDF